MRVPATFRARLVVTGLITSMSLVGGVGAFLLWNQGQQATAGVSGEAATRAGIAQQMLDRVAQPELSFAAQDLAGQAALRTALGSATPSKAVAAVFAEHDAIQIPGANIAVFARDGTLVGDVETVPSSKPTSGLSSLQLIAFGAAGERTPTASGIETVGGLTSALDVAVPVHGADGGLLGAVLYSAPLEGLMSRYGPVIGPYPIVIAATGAAALRVSTNGTSTTARLPGDIIAALPTRVTATSADAWSSPTYATGGGDVVGGYVALTGPDGHVAGYLGVEAPLAGVTAQTNSGQRAIVVIALSAALIMSLSLLILADRFLRRPVARLERNVAAIAAGDYATPITTTGDDEVGRLARSVESMRVAIASAGERRDSSDLQLREVSRALTTTTSGTDELRRAVVAAAQAIAGAGAWADLALRGEATALDTDLLDAAERARLLAGESLEADRGRHHLLAVPMLTQDRVTAALTVTTPATLSPTARNALTILANNGAIALANSRVYEQERDALRVMRELHTMKADFMSITQHELRTPVHAILGYIELLGMTWSQWNEAQRSEALDEIETSARQLAALVENIVQFSLLGTESTAQNRRSVAVQPAIARAVDDVARLCRGGLDVTVHTESESGLTVDASEDRFHLALRCLLDNAIKFSPSGSVVRVVARRDGADFVRVDVVDNGAGIPASALDRIFDRFYQVESGVNRPHAGMGLGLSVVRRLCEENAATVTADSVIGRGSRFSLRWPAGR